MIRRNTAPGRDGIEYDMIKLLPERMQQEMLEIFNGIWCMERIPKSWQEYQVIFIDKPGQEKVRPIALASCMCKMMERLVNERLVWWAERRTESLQKIRMDSEEENHVQKI